MKDIALIGCGKWGKNLAHTFNTLGVLKTICDQSEHTLCMLNYPEVGLEQDWRIVLADNRIKGVVIALPSSMHYEVAREALLAKKDVFIEKPMTMNSREARKLVNAAGEQVLMVGHMTLFMDNIRDMKRKLNGADIHSLYLTRTNPAGFKKDESIIWRLMPHDVATMLYMLDAKAKDVKDITSFTDDGGGDAYAWMLCKDLPVVIYASWVAQEKRRDIVAVTNSDILSTSEDKAINPLLNECQHFLRCMETRESPITDGAFGSEVVRVLEKIEKGRSDSTD
jgi:UDP-2-acetamido-3-amino-2,3-dideoxy-glucuronate N-acetyltransferase